MKAQQHSNNIDSSTYLLSLSRGILQSNKADTALPPTVHTLPSSVPVPVREEEPHISSIFPQSTWTWTWTWTWTHMLGVDLAEEMSIHAPRQPVQSDSPGGLRVMLHAGPFLDDSWSVQGLRECTFGGRNRDFFSCSPLLPPSLLPSPLLLFSSSPLLPSPLLFFSSSPLSYSPLLFFSPLLLFPPLSPSSSNTIFCMYL